MYPPKPAGVAIMEPGRPAEYLAWGHPSENNTTASAAQERLRSIWRSGRPLLFHHAKFDLEVAQKWFGLPLPAWELVHDTMYLIFLNNPHSKTLSLKPASAELLGLPPAEQDAVHQWLIDNGVVKKGKKDWGAHICAAPGGLVGKYAIGDVERTLKLFQLLHPRIVEKGMERAYSVERRLMPMLLKNEQTGIRLDVERLAKDTEAYTHASGVADTWLRSRLGADFNIDSAAELAEALSKAGVVTEWKLTPTGKRSTAKGAMPPKVFNDPEVASVLGYRSRLDTCLNTFMRPWLAMAQASDGRIATQWNQVRTAHGVEDTTGARTGRMSSSRPNFQNIPKSWTDKNDGFVQPKSVVLPPLPYLRGYVLPDPGDLLLHRDFNSQELRLLAHFEDAAICQAYNDNPYMDIHETVRGLIRDNTGHDLERRYVKTLNFGLLYGMGLASLGEALGISKEKAADLRKAQRGALPGLARLEGALRKRGQDGDPIRTWGGRLYYCEPPTTTELPDQTKQTRTYEYKLLNYLVQGSAADVTKQALLNYADASKHSRFLLTVHDEINISAPPEHAAEELELLREAMEYIELEVPLLTDAKMGTTWGSLEKVEEHEDVYSMVAQ